MEPTQTSNVNSPVQSAMIQAAATIAAARIAVSGAQGNAKSEVDVAVEIERAWIAISEGVARGRKAVVEAKRAAKQK